MEDLEKAASSRGPASKRRYLFVKPARRGRSGEFETKDPVPQWTRHYYAPSNEAF